MKRDPYAPFRYPAFRIFLFGGLLVQIGTAAQSLAVGWEIYSRTGEPLGHTGGRHEAHIGVAQVPDPRLDRLTELFEPRRRVPATVEIAELAGHGGARSLIDVTAFRNADALREVARQVPADRLLVETDSPYLAPVPHRGKPNEPQYVCEVAAFLAELRGETLEQLQQQTTDNFHRLFPLAAG